MPEDLKHTTVCFLPIEFDGATLRVRYKGPRGQQTIALSQYYVFEWVDKDGNILHLPWFIKGITLKCMAHEPVEIELQYVEQVPDH